MVLPAPPELTESERKWLMTTRQTLIMRLGAVEERLGMEQSIVPKHKKKTSPVAGLEKTSERKVR